MTLADITAEEQAVIDELKNRTINIVTPRMLKDKYVFYRFAKARDYNLADAESMLRKHLVWRKEIEYDILLTDYKPPEVLGKYVPTNFLCLDKSGCAVRYVDCGRADAKGLWNSAKRQEIIKYCCCEVQKDFEEVYKLNETLPKQLISAIFNFENLQYAVAYHMKTLQYILYFLKCYLDNFPETLKYAFVINAPFYFIWMYSVIKQILPAAVISKVRLYGSDGYQGDLLELIDADVLPVFLGGNKTDPDGSPRCETLMNFGKNIPKSYYMENAKKRMRVGCEKLTIPPFSKEEISFEVKEVNSYLQWEFDIKSRNIEFSLHFKGEHLENTELIPKQRIDTYCETEKGFVKCEKVGNYTIVLDNTYSWIHSKEVYYTAEVRSPSDDRSEEPLWH